jgi:hypothetical protein
MLRALFVGSAALMVLAVYANAEAADCKTVRCKAGYSCAMKGSLPKCVAQAGDCSAIGHAQINFYKNWSSNVIGTLKAGGCVTIWYSADRGTITNSHGASPCWGIQGYLKFTPSNASQEFKAMDFVNYYGRTTNTPDNKYTTKFTIPVGTKAVELWFKRWTACDSPREAWDSRYGKNYKFSVQ